MILMPDRSWPGLTKTAETRWKGSKARSIADGCIIFYHGEDEGEMELELYRRKVTSGEC